MTIPLSLDIETITNAIVSAPRAWLFLDYDGTLAPIAPTPDEAVPLPGIVDILGRLAALRRLHVAIVTGRSIANVRRFIDLPGLHYVGLHGAERQTPGGTIVVAPGAAALREALPRLAHQLSVRLTGRLGILFEDKGAALACHYRLASRLDAVDAKRCVEEIAAEYRSVGGEVAVLHGHEVSELRPVGINKGVAVLDLITARPSDATVYAGDDVTDEDAFAQLPRDAITIRVAATDIDTAARYRAQSPAEIRSLLVSIDRSLQLAET